MPTENDSGLLRIALQTAVPLWILKFRNESFEYMQKRGEICSQIIAEHGDHIMFKGGKKGETASAFNALAEGLAILAHAPGGVTVFGCHWEAGRQMSRDELSVLNRAIRVLEDGKVFLSEIKR